MLISLARDGWTEAESDEDADLVILNTCSVRETAEERIRGRLGFYRHAKKHRPFTLVLTGCMAERLKDAIIDEHPEVDVVLGTFSKSDLAAAVARPASARSPSCRGGSARIQLRRYSFLGRHEGLCTHHARVQQLVLVLHRPPCSRPRGLEITRRYRGGDSAPCGARLQKRSPSLGQNVNSYLWREGAATLRFPGLCRRSRKRAARSAGCAFSPRTPRISPMSWCRSLPKPPSAAATSTSRFRAGPRPFFSA